MALTKRTSLQHYSNNYGRKNIFSTGLRSHALTLTAHVAKLIGATTFGQHAISTTAKGRPN